MLEAMFAESLSIAFFNIGMSWNIFNPQPSLLCTLSYYDNETAQVSTLHYKFCFIKIKMLNTPYHSV